MGQSIRDSIRVGILGVGGYGGGEALRLCAGHPRFEVVYASGESNAGKKLVQLFPGISPRLAGLVVQTWDPAQLKDVDLIFASLPSGASKNAFDQLPDHVKIVDIGGDNRYAPGWTYGLADIWPERIIGQSRIANPGCYPSAALTAIAPLVAAGVVDPKSPIIIDAKSGVSGAGRGGGSTFGFADVNEDVTAYALGRHAHVPEMTKTLNMLGKSADFRITFTPHLIPMTRGILATCYLGGSASTEQCLQMARDFYKDRPFVRVVDTPPHTKHATASNFVFIHYHAIPGGPIIALGAIDNLGKGAAGQALQNANLIMGLEAQTGLLGAPLWP